MYVIILEIIAKPNVFVNLLLTYRKCIQEVVIAKNE